MRWRSTRSAFAKSCRRSRHGPRGRADPGDRAGQPAAFPRGARAAAMFFCARSSDHETRERLEGIRVELQRAFVRRLGRRRSPFSTAFSAPFSACTGVALGYVFSSDAISTSARASLALRQESARQAQSCNGTTWRILGRLLRELDRAAASPRAASASTAAPARRPRADSAAALR